MNIQLDTGSESNESASSLESQEADGEIYSLIGYVFAYHKNFYERVDNHSDPYPFLELRKSFLRIFRGMRETARLIIQSTFFEAFIITVILFNSVALALASDDSFWGTVDLVFLAIYTAECGLKVIGMGFLFKKRSYLRDYWNILDFTIVVTGWVEIIAQEGVNLSALRVLRVLRPLRSISSIEGMKIIFRVLISSIRPLMSTISILGFFLLIFAIGGLQVWMGVLKYRCIEVNDGIIGSDSDICGNVSCGDNTKCASVLDNPNLGITSFDNIFISLVTVFQFITLEGWRDIMVFYEKAFSLYVFIYFVPLVFIGALFLINLALAVIKLKLSDTIKAETEKKKRKRVRRRTDLSFVNKMKQTHMVKKKEYNHVSDCEELKPSNCYIFNEDRKLLMMGLAGIKSAPYMIIPIESPNSAEQIVLKEDNNNDQNIIVEEETEREISEIFKLPHNLMVLCASEKEQEKLITEQKTPLFRINEKHSLEIHSSEDVLPKIIIEEPVVALVYRFQHTIPEDVMPIAAADMTKEFNRIAGRMHLATAYGTVTYSVKSYVKLSKRSDKEKNCVEAEWSGKDIEPNADHDFEVYDLSTVLLYSLGIKRYYDITIMIVKYIVEHKFFNFGISTCVFINTLVLAMDHYGISQEMELTLNYINLVFTAIFAAEMVLKLVGLGVKLYVRDLMNCFDGLVVLLSLLDIFIFNDESSAISAFRAFRIFRTFRVLRIARLFRYLEYMSKLLRVVGNTLSISVYLALILLLFTTIFALVGMQLFEGKFNFREGRPRAHFDDFHWSFVTVFQVLSLENWNTVLYDAMRSSVGPSSSLFFIVWIVIGNFVLLNIFLAVLLDSFSEESTPKYLSSRNTNQSSNSMKSSRLTFLEQDKQMQRLMEEINAEESDSSDVEQRQRRSHLKTKKSLFVFTDHSWLRQKCKDMVKSSKFENSILVLILLSSLKLVLDTYWMDKDENSAEMQASYIIDIIFTCLFTLEMLFKTISSGFLLDKETYLRDPWNQLDFLIVIVSWLDMVLTSNSIQAIKVIRLLRTIRPLRFISHNVSMRIVINALIESSAAIVNVGIVILIIWLIFAILGVSFFGGKFYTCENPLIDNLELCEAMGLSWQNADTNFDNVLEAMMTLFVISSLEGWPNVMLLGVDATHPGHAPVKDNNPAAAYYFVIFVVIGSFFFLNLFIGVMFEKFQESKNNEASFSSSFLTRKQQLWVEMQKLVPNSKPQLDFSKVPETGIRKLCHTVATSTVFEIIISNCILLNMIQMAAIYDGASAEYDNALEILNLALTVVFALEALIKIIGLGFTLYFYDTWNKFDFAVVAASLIEIIFQYAFGTTMEYLRTGPQLARTFRIVRVGRLIRLVKSLKDIQAIMETIKYTIPSMLNILSLLMIIFFIYSVLGVFLFHEIKSGEVIDDYNNFWDFLTAMVTLLRISTGEDWYSLMYDCKRHNAVAAYMYFSSFNIITSFVVLNLFVMITVQALNDHYDNPESPIDAFNRSAKQFKEIWAKYSTLYKGVKMHGNLLEELIRELSPPLVPVNTGSQLEIAKIITALNVPVDQTGYIYYHELLFCLFKRSFGNFRFRGKDVFKEKIILMEEKKTLEQIKKVTQKIKQKNKVYFNSRVNFFADGDCLNPFSSYIVLKKVITRWKEWKDKRKLGYDDSDDDLPKMRYNTSYPNLQYKSQTEKSAQKQTRVYKKINTVRVSGV